MRRPPQPQKCPPWNAASPNQGNRKNAECVPMLLLHLGSDYADIGCRQAGDQCALGRIGAGGCTLVCFSRSTAGDQSANGILSRLADGKASPAGASVGRSAARTNPHRARHRRRRCIVSESLSGRRRTKIIWRAERSGGWQLINGEHRIGAQAPITSLTPNLLSLTPNLGMILDLSVTTSGVGAEVLSWEAVEFVKRVSE